ncbi:MAG: conjugal transfer protein TraF [Candidatus Thiodiazotropha endolucinida]|nr:conjugal transfer protein TraF [Candidatus Thiodiazotropha taylori]MCW4250833.1 conjugal transfer protein TraF [Candidatus Thiodiazotropha endolucinida]MCG8040096.1 conjugal transfer protein TraF [Candidatus Thiodiazotropha taylori]MCG8104551.1 conjugal transfer protein TraF [Candidatus Thiodiazotropha taylori]MCG8121827.1 conjugal transfer protein TraF [Candidatus Thiodiazotropha taylori]
MCRILVGFISLILAGYATAEAPGGDRWLDRKSEGWFWYKAEPEPVEPEEVKQPPKQPVSTTPPPQEAGPAPLSSAWIRENIQVYLDAALDNPTPENVAAFLYIQRYAMDKSFAFMDASQEVTLGNSALDEINRRPTATFANRKLDETATANNKYIIDKISSTAGIFFFMDGSEASMAQAEVLDMLERNYQFDTVKIAAVELPPEQYEQGIRKDSGHAQQMGITSLPAIVLLRSDGLFDIVSQAPVSYSDLQKRLLVGAKRLGIISETEFNSTRPISNITNTLVSLPESQGTNNSSVPIPADQIIKAFNGGK